MSAISAGIKVILSRTFKNWSSIFHIKYSPPKEVDRCDKCSGSLYQRDDDTEETVKNRLNTYENITKPLIDYYKKQGILESLDSDGSIDEMHQKVSKLLVTRFKE